MSEAFDRLKRSLDYVAKHHSDVDYIMNAQVFEPKSLSCVFVCFSPSSGLEAFFSVQLFVDLFHGVNLG